MVEEMSDDAVLELGWGRLIFGQTFTDPDKLAAVLQQEVHGRRDICIYARESHVLVAKSPAELFIDPSHTYRWRLGEDEPDSPTPIGFSVRTLREKSEADAINRVYVRCAHGAGAVRGHLEQPSARRRGRVPDRRARPDDGSVVGTVTGVDHKRLFNDPEDGSSLWTLAVDPTAELPGIGGALTRTLAADLPRRGRAYLDLSVTYDNDAAIALYEKLGFRGSRCWRSSARTRSTSRCSTPQSETVDDLNPYARIIADEAMRRGIYVEVIDAETGEMRLTHGGRSVVTRESLSRVHLRGGDEPVR